MATTEFRIMGIIGAPAAAAVLAAGDWDELVGRTGALEESDSSTRWQAQPDADNTSTTSTTNYTAAGDYTFTLPAGEWTVTVVAAVKLKHSASGTANARVQIAGDVGTAYSYPSLPSANYEACFVYHQVTGVTGGSKTIRVEYKSSTAGTTSGDNPVWWIRYDKTSTPA